MADLPSVVSPKSGWGPVALTGDPSQPWRRNGPDERSCQSDVEGVED
jgi:hypothetical protein